MSFVSEISPGVLACLKPGNRRFLIPKNRRRTFHERSWNQRTNVSCNKKDTSLVPSAPTQTRFEKVNYWRQSDTPLHCGRPKRSGFLVFLTTCSGTCYYLSPTTLKLIQRGACTPSTPTPCRSGAPIPPHRPSHWSAVVARRPRRPRHRTYPCRVPAIGFASPHGTRRPPLPLRRSHILVAAVAADAASSVVRRPAVTAMRLPFRGAIPPPSLPRLDQPWHVTRRPHRRIVAHIVASSPTTPCSRRSRRRLTFSPPSADGAHENTWCLVHSMQTLL